MNIKSTKSGLTWCFGRACLLWSTTFTVHLLLLQPCLSCQVGGAVCQLEASCQPAVDHTSPVKPNDSVSLSITTLMGRGWSPRIAALMAVADRVQATRQIFWTTFQSIDDGYFLKDNPAAPRLRRLLSSAVLLKSRLRRFNDLPSITSHRHKLAAARKLLFHDLRAWQDIVSNLDGSHPATRLGPVPPFGCDVIAPPQKSLTTRTQKNHQPFGVISILQPQDDALELWRGGGQRSFISPQLLILRVQSGLGVHHGALFQSLAVGLRIVVPFIAHAFGVLGS